MIADRTFVATAQMWSGMRAHGLTIRNIADLTGVSKSQVHRELPFHKLVASVADELEYAPGDTDPELVLAEVGRRLVPGGTATDREREAYRAWCPDAVPDGTKKRSSYDRLVGAWNAATAEDRHRLLDEVLP